MKKFKVVIEELGGFVGRLEGEVEANNEQEACEKVEEEIASIVGGDFDYGVAEAHDEVIEP